MITRIRSLAVAVVVLSSMTVFSQDYLPSQFIAKMYTEALGRAPDGAGWAAYHSYFAQYGRNLATLTACATGFFTGQEYNGLNYTPGEKVFTLYRAILCREPDVGGYNYWVTQLTNGTVSMAQAVAVFTGTSEFQNLLPAIFGGGSYNSTVSFGVNFPFDRSDPGTISPPTGQVLFTGSTRSDLQALLNNPGTGNTVVVLRPKTVVKIDAPLVIPNGMTLSTYNDGSLTLSRYARFARLIRDPTSTSLSLWNGNGVVNIQSGAILQYIFVDGASNWVSLAQNRVSTAFGNIYVVPNNTNPGTAIFNCRSSDIQTGSNLVLAQGTWNPHIEVIGNLLTGYERSHYPNALDYPIADGITCIQMDCNIQWNSVIDPTDVGIIVMNHSGNIQHSQVINNTIINAGNGAFACLCLCADSSDASTSRAAKSFSGTNIKHNNIMMGHGPWVHYDFGISVNVLPWCFTWINRIIGPLAIDSNNLAGYYMAFTFMKCNTPIVISDANGVTITNNDLRPSIVRTCSDPNHLMQTGACVVSSTTSSLRYSNNTPGMSGPFYRTESDVYCILNRHIHH